MVVSITSNVNTYIGAGNASVYPFTFPVFTQTDIVVSVVDPTGLTTYSLTLGLDFSVSGLITGASIANTGAITLINNSQAWLTAGNLTSLWTLTIERIVPLSQSTSIRNEGSYFPETIENALDYLTMICQQLQEAITVIGTPSSTTNFPPYTIDIIPVSTTPQTIVSGGIYLVDSSIGAVQLNLPAPTSTTWFIVKDAAGQARTNNITIHRNASEQIDGVSSDFIIAANNAAWFFVSNGTNWYSVGSANDLILNDITAANRYRVLISGGILSTQLL